MPKLIFLISLNLLQGCLFSSNAKIYNKCEDKAAELTIKIEELKNNTDNQPIPEPDRCDWTVEYDDTFDKRDYTSFDLYNNAWQMIFTQSPFVAYITIKDES